MFEPQPDCLMPLLGPQEELALLARSLWREGYNDHLSGHITINAGDGTLWCNPGVLTWEELRPRDVIRIDLDGRVVEGDWPAPQGIPLHLALHRARPETKVAAHAHPLYGTVWAGLCQLPPPMDQSSVIGGGGLVLVDEYDNPVNDPDAARAAVAKLGDAEVALLAGHGVLVTGLTVRAVHQRAVTLEIRCHHALLAHLVIDGPTSPLPAAFVERSRQSDGNQKIGGWEAAVRAELRADPSLLDHRLGSMTR